MRAPTVADAMSTSLIKLDSKKTLVDAAKLMKKNDIRSLLAVDGKKFAGLLTAGDIVGAVATGKDIKKTKIADAMSKKPVTITSETSLVEAMKLMVDRKIKRLVVLDAGKLKGILTDGDALRHAPELIDYLTAELEELGERRGSEQEGDVCESCGNYAVDLKKINGEWVCEECRETSTYI